MNNSEYKNTVLSIVIPFYNEEETVAYVCEEVNTVFASLYHEKWELIMVNDGSTDQTGNRINSLADRFDHFRAVHINPNSGQSAALWAGFRLAKGDIIGTMDGDGQNNPKDFPKLLGQMEERNVDMMCGIRTPRNDSIVRKLSSRIANRIRAAILNDGITDVGCSIRVFRQTCLEKLYFFKNAHRFFPALVMMAGYQVGEIPVSHRPRINGTSKYGGGIRSRLFAGLFDLLGVFWMRRRFLKFSASEYRPFSSIPDEEKQSYFLHDTPCIQSGRHHTQQHPIRSFQP